MKKPYAVSAANPFAVEVGMDIMDRGGNAVDAAIAVSFALGVVEPYASGIGGGGNMLIYPTGRSTPIIYDYRETAPSYVNWKYNVGVPGFIKGMERIANDYANFDLGKLIEPSIELAKNGFPINRIMSNQLKTTKYDNMFYLKHFYPNNSPLENNDILYQKELANSLKMLSLYGAEYFYQGEIGKRIASLNIGIEQNDLEQYEIVIREPIMCNYDMYQIWTAPAPVGGCVLIQALKMADILKLNEYEATSIEFMTKLGLILRKIYQLRIRYNGDPEFTCFDETKFINDSYIKKIVSSIDVSKIDDELYEYEDYNQTTHFSIVDSDGMAVSTTNTISNLFGSGIYVEGFFLNNQIRNFSKNRSSPNYIKASKRSTGLISPTIITKNQRPYLIIGSSGGERISTMLTCTIIKFIKQGYSLEDAVKENRFFANKNKEIYTEYDLTELEKQKLEGLGFTHIYHPVPMFYGGVHALAIEENEVFGAADPRRGGTWRSSTRTKKII